MKTQEKRNKIQLNNINKIGNLSLIIGSVIFLVILLSSCGTSKTFHVGTGQETYNSCGATFIK
jgi:hypothetical protein